MKNDLIWSGLAVSVRGPGHEKTGLPCQDASAVQQSPQPEEGTPNDYPAAGFGRPALIVCDGRGSSSRSQDGSAGAVRAFMTQIAIFENLMAATLDENRDDAPVEQWEKTSMLLYRTLWQVQKDLAAEQKVKPSEFDFTVAAAVIGSCWIGCFQVGDGAIVLQQDATPITAFLPDRGEFVSQTMFLMEGGEKRGKFHSAVFPAENISGIAILSDGPVRLMFKNLNEMIPGDVFPFLFAEMRKGTITKQVLVEYLTREEWVKDGSEDDKSLAVLVSSMKKPAEAAEKAPASPENGDEAASPKPDPDSGKQTDSGDEKQPSQAETGETVKTEDNWETGETVQTEDNWETGETGKTGETVSSSPMKPDNQPDAAGKEDPSPRMDADAGETASPPSPPEPDSMTQSGAAEKTDEQKDLSATGCTTPSPDVEQSILSPEESPEPLPEPDYSEPASQDTGSRQTGDHTTASASDAQTSQNGQGTEAGKESKCLVKKARSFFGSVFRS